MIKQSEKWDRFYLNLAEYVSRLSKDPSTKVGAVVVNWEHQQEFIGYNAFPKGVRDLIERYEDRNLKYEIIRAGHAERNAIRKANIVGMARGASLYVYPVFSFPPVCSDCAGEAIASGIAEVVGYKPKMDTVEEIERVKRWEDSIKISRMMCEEAGITWREIEQEKMDDYAARLSVHA